MNKGVWILEIRDELRGRENISTVKYILFVSPFFFFEISNIKEDVRLRDRWKQ